MHELSLCRSILTIINEQLAGKTVCKVKKVVLEIGELTAVDPESLLFNFDVAVKGTLAEGARLELIPIEGRGICQNCQKQVHIKRYYDGCHACGQFSLTITQGEELRVKCLEIME